MNRSVASLVIGVGLLVLPRPTFAHVTIWPLLSHADAVERYTVRVPTERTVSTMSVELEIPAGVTVTGVLAPAGFTYDLKKDGSRITAITWKQEIKAGEVGEFVFFARNPAVPIVTWKAHQHYADGQADDWVGPSGDRRPAPVVKLMP